MVYVVYIAIGFFIGVIATLLTIIVSYDKYKEKK